MRRFEGEKKDNMEDAIRHYQDVLLADFNDYEVHYELGKVYMKRIYGLKAINVEEAIKHLELALTTLFSNAMLYYWLGEAYMERFYGNKSQNLENAINYYKLSLSLELKSNNPSLWACKNFKLGKLYEIRRFGSKKENIELAIQYFRKALEFYTKKSYPKDWVVTKIFMGNAFKSRVKGDSVKNIDKAIQCYNEALEICTHEIFLAYWACIQHNIGDIYKSCVKGIRSENIENAILFYKKSLEVRTCKDYPKDWASTTAALAGAYRVRIEGSRVDNIEKANELYRKALKVLTRVAYPDLWGYTKMSLGLSLISRIKGSPADNVEEAKKFFEQALEVFKREDNPEDWAIAQLNLGFAWRHRIKGSKDENLRKAIKHYVNALEVHSRKDYPELWARDHHNLAVVYTELTDGELSENLEEAIVHYKKALEVRTRSALPEYWAMAQLGLAAVYIKRIEGVKSENLYKSIEYSRKAQEIYTRDAYPEAWFMIQQNLGVAYQSFQGKYNEEAISCYQKALELLTPQAYPLRYRDVALNLEILAFGEKRWELARYVSEQAFVAQKILIHASITQSGKQVEIEAMQYKSQRAAYVYAQLGEMEMAVEVLEQNRAQLLRESLERQRRDLKKLSVLGFNDLYKEYLQARRKYSELQLITDTDDFRSSDWLAEAEHALEKMQSIEAIIREKVGKNYHQYRYFMQSMPFSEIQKQAFERPLVYLCSTSAGGLALIVAGHGVQSLILPELNQSSLLSQFWDLSIEKLERLNIQIQKGTVTSEDVLSVSGKYLAMYRLWSMSSYLFNTSTEVRGLINCVWERTLNSFTRWLWDVLMGQLVDILGDHAKSVTLIPTGRLALLPLHAAWTEDITRPTGRRYALDQLNISYAPSAHALWQASLGSDRSSDIVMAVDNPKSDDPFHALHFSEYEVKTILTGFRHKKLLPGKDATIESVKTEMQQANVFHFSCHGKAGWDDPEQASLQLADGDMTLPELFSLDLDKARLAVLSACETGIPGLELLDEMIGLPSGMMQAGVPGVVGSLWSVNDMSTALLMVRFYSLWRDTVKSPQEALREAQIWLRDITIEELKHYLKNMIDSKTLTRETGQLFYQQIAFKKSYERHFESPYHWAAFTYTGV